MTPSQLQDWMNSKGWNKSTTSRELGVGRARLDRYLVGEQPIPRYIELACIALNYGNSHEAT